MKTVSSAMFVVLLCSLFVFASVLSVAAQDEQKDMKSDEITQAHTMMIDGSKKMIEGARMMEEALKMVKENVDVIKVESLIREANKMIQEGYEMMTKAQQTIGDKEMMPMMQRCKQMMMKKHKMMKEKGMMKDDMMKEHKHPMNDEPKK